MNPIFTGKVERGKVLLDSPSRYLVHLSKYEGKRIELVLRLQKSQRSLNQNNYYFGVVVEILSGHTGYTAEEMHEILKYKFLKTIKVIPDKEGMPYIKSTTKLNTGEFEEYLAKIKQWAAQELDVFIPDPNDYEAV